MEREEDLKMKAIPEVITDRSHVISIDVSDCILGWIIKVTDWSNGSVKEGMIEKDSALIREVAAVMPRFCANLQRHEESRSKDPGWKDWRKEK